MVDSPVPSILWSQGQISSTHNQCFYSQILYYICHCFEKKDKNKKEAEFGPYKSTSFLQQINVENVHPVSGARIRTHGIQIMSLLP